MRANWTCLALVSWYLLAPIAVAQPAAPAKGQAEAARPASWAQPLEQKGLPNLFRVAPNLYRGAQPTAEGMKNLEKMGIKTVVNLRWMHSDDDELEGTKLRAVHIPFNPSHAEREEVVRFLKVVADPANHPVFVHCQHGADRTGTMVALYRIVIEGWSKQDALREMTDGGYGFHSIWKNLPRFIRKLDTEQLKKEILPRAAKQP